MVRWRAGLRRITQRGVQSYGANCCADLCAALITSPAQDRGRQLQCAASCAAPGTSAFHRSNT